MKKIKICHITSAHNRYDGRIFAKQCTSLAKKYDVTLLCCDEFDDEVKNNVKIISTGKKLKNIYERLLFSKRYLKKKCNEINADVYQLHDPELLSLTNYLKKKKKIVIFDSHEDHVSLFLERQWIPKVFRKILMHIYAYYERKNLKKIDYVICAADHIKERIKLINTNCDIIPNFPILENSIEKKQDANKLTLCFAGTINKFWNHDVIIKAIQDIENVNYLLIGNCSVEYKKYLKSIDKNCKTVFKGKLSYEEVKKNYCFSDVGIALCSYRPNVDYKNGSLGITKIFEFMMYKMPVIFTDFKVFKKINNKKKYGIAVNPYNVTDVKSAILKFKNNRKIIEEYGINGRSLIETQYNWNVLEKKLFNIYDFVLSERK